MDKVDYEAKLAEEVVKLRKYQQALLEEHAQIIAEASEGEPRIEAAVVYAAAEQKLLKQVDKATDTLIHVLEYGDKDATRVQVAKYIIDVAKQNPTPGIEDPWDALVKKLTASETT